MIRAMIPLSSETPRRAAAGCLVLLLLPAAASTFAAEPDSRPSRPNILLITADDMSYDSLGVTGCPLPGITANLDRLASQGMRFANAHVTVAVCQPSRSVLMTGRYPHRNGSVGFEPIRQDVPTLQESLRRAGYINGILAKTTHLAPAAKFCWDVVVPAEELGQGRDPAAYYRHAREFFDRARAESRPFFLMANSQDPHRPFAGSEPRPGATRRAGRRGASRRTEAARSGPVGRTYRPEDVPVPGFLPDLPEIREELAHYYASVHRCDETVGQVLRALDESGLAGDTLVMFLSDNGMSFPFAKTNCYPFSTRTPWIVRWPGRVKPGVVDVEHFVSGIDFMPTILDAAGLPNVDGMDGRSFLPILQGNRQSGRDRVFTAFGRTSAGRDYPMRCVQDRAFAYIFNAWSDGTNAFQNESMGSSSFAAMRRAAEKDPALAARIDFYLHRTPEELYDLRTDPDARRNRIGDPTCRDELALRRGEMLRMMESTGDPLTQTYRAYLKRSGFPGAPR